VVPPFPAPPVEGRSTRIWLGLGVAGLAVLLCCGGGLAAGIGLVFTGVEAINERAHVAVRDYLDAVQARRFDDAYDALCPELRARESESRFAQRLAAEPRITAYEPGDLNPNISPLVVPVDVEYANGMSGTLRIRLEQDSRTGEFEVCGIER
jgi:hypothetical protein